MQDPESNRNAGRESPDPPTVRSGTGPGPGAGAEPGSSFRRKAGVLPLPEPGDRVDTFDLERAIGVGGMGAVFRAMDLRLERLVALKILPPEQAGDSEVVQRFYQEARAAARLDHENIARVYTIGHDGKYHYIAFEFIEGTTVRQRVADVGPLPVGEAINYTLQIAGALVHAAERGVVHRDIKPSNIIVTPQGRAKLVDMGLARRFERGGDDDGLTQSGTTLGTFDYISPEQARDPRDVDVRSDLYSLGCTLYHMVTGQPPFPQGTLLQKLLQHQEEPPPDVRGLNPAVPPDLAAVLMKLMAKDRDRRYQTPEQLARDLLTVAGALGLRSVSPEGLVWLGPTRPPAWERHLVWGVPTLALALVVLALVWWGQQGEPAAAVVARPEVPPAVASPAVARAETPRAATPAATAPAGPAAEAESAREYTVRAGEDLAAVLESAPSGSTVTLADAGPYDLRPRPTARAATARLPRRDLTLRAAPDARPVLRLAPGADGEGDAPGDAALLRFGPGRVVLEGLHFVLDPGDRDDPLAAVFAEDTDLTVRRTLFRRAGGAGGAGRLAALRLRSAEGDVGRRPAPVRVTACHIDGDQVGVLARGPAEVELDDVTIGPGGPAVWFDNAAALAPVPVRLGLRHVSLMAGDGPALRLNRTAAVVRVEDSVIAPGRDDRPTLVATDDPDRLDWLGRGNLYGPIGTYLQPTRDLAGRGPVRSFDDWADGPEGPREVDSTTRPDGPWAEADPAAALARSDPSAAFGLRPGDARGAALPGARRGPFGTLAAATELLAGLLNPARPRRPARVAAPAMPRIADRTDPDDERPGPAARPEEPLPGPMPVEPVPDEDARPAPMPVEPMAEPRPVTTATLDPPGAPVPSEIPAAEPASPPARPGPSLRLPGEPVVAGPPRPRPGAERPAEPAEPAIRTEDQFLDALRRPGPRGGTIRLAADADLALPACEIEGAGTWMVEAEPGPTRPRLRFRPEADGMRNGSLPALFRVRAGGSLELRGVDVVLPAAAAPGVGRWAAFALSPGADLDLRRCTVTVEGREVRSAVIAVPAGDDGAGEIAARVDPAAALVRATDCLLRGGGDLIDVDPGRRVDAEIDGAVIATGGALVHGHGSARLGNGAGGGAEPLKLTLRRVTARNAEGLVWLESQPGEPDLPTADVVARDSIVATTPDGGPLFRVDEQEPSDPPRERIRWQGHSVAYHKITTYRRDQAAQPGSMPVRFDRPAWEVAVFPREVDPVHEDVRFRKEWDPRRPPWTLAPADVRLADDTPAPSAGADLDRIPAPPGR